MSTELAIIQFYLASTTKEYAALGHIRPVDRTTIVRRTVLWSIYKKANE